MNAENELRGETIDAADIGAATSPRELPSVSPEVEFLQAQGAYEEAVGKGLDYIKRRRKAIAAGVSNRNVLVDKTIDELLIKRRKEILKKDPKFKFVNRVARAMVYHELIAQCRNAYREHGIIKNTLDLLSNFVSRVSIFHPDPKWQQFYNSWATRVNLNERINTFVRDLFEHGQIFIYRTMAEITPADKRTMRRTTAIKEKMVEGDSLVIHRENHKMDVITPKSRQGFDNMANTAKADFGEIPESRENFIPWDYSSLNPLQMEPVGGIFKGESKWRFLLKEEDLDTLGLTSFNTIVDEGETRTDMPKDFKARIKKHEAPLTADFDLEVALPNDRLYIIFDKKHDWEDWAVPMVYPALKNLRLKQCLRNMEMRAAQSVIASIMLIKLGHIASNGKVLLPPPGAVDTIGEMLREPGESTHLIWGTPDIEAEYVQPSLGDIFGSDKMESVDADILADLGASEVVINGRGGGNYSNAFLSVAAMLERLENVREKFRTWLLRELRILGQAVGDTKVPSIKFETTSLRDERVRNDFMIKLFTMNRLSSETLWQQAGIDPKCEVARLNREEEMMKKGELPLPKGPFKNPLGDTVVEEGMREDDDGTLPSREEELERRIEEQERMNEVNNNGEGDNPQGPNQRGRPRGTTDRQQEVKRDTKPKGMADLDPALVKKYEQDANRIAKEARAVLYRDALVAAEVNRRADLSENLVAHIEGLVTDLVAQASVGDQVNKEYVKKFYTEGPAKVDRCVKDVMKDKVASFRKRNGKAPSSAQRKKMLSSAFAICNASVKK